MGNFAWLGLLSRVVVTTFAAVIGRQEDDSDAVATCPGYWASNVQTTASALTASLTLAGPACNVYGTDLADLILEVTYETATRLHVKIQDAANDVYQIPESHFTRPQAELFDASESALKFSYAEKPFSFTVSRSESGEVLFDSSAASLVFESQYLRLRTKLPSNPSLYGLGEHSDSFRLRTTNYTRTLWAQDSYGVPESSNLYGSHPVYMEHRPTGTHAVFLLNSNGMDITINESSQTGQYLEYQTIGGVLDLYFVAGPWPVQVAQQYAQVVGLPAFQPYWSLGFHQCRYGYQDVFDVAEVVYNYSQAGIPLETMWTDIDYMDLRITFSLDPERFPLHLMRELVDYLHAHGQHYIMMVDPAMAVQDSSPTYQRGLDTGSFLLRPNGSLWLGALWPGVVAFPDWFAVNTSEWWRREFEVFFSPKDGVNISGVWLDMNEPSNFACPYPCDDPYGAADKAGLPPVPPPVRTPPRPLPGFSCSFQPPGTDGCSGSNLGSWTVPVPAGRIAQSQAAGLASRQAGGLQLGLPGRNLLSPKYSIANKAAYRDDWNDEEAGLSNKTVSTNVIHQNGLAMYDTHNLYGSLMNSVTHAAMVAREPSQRPFLVTRSTFAGDGKKVAHWLGDNVSKWDHLRLSIRSMLAYGAIYQIPMVGADVCGFSSNTNEQLCARWAAAAAFVPFYRNHNEAGNIGQEFYRWASVASVARKFIAIRYRLLDYLYTALQRQHLDGTPSLSPVFFLYPQEQEAWGLELEYFLGPGLLVAPVTEENAATTQVYLPRDLFYDFYTHAPVQGAAANVTVDASPSWSNMPLYYRGGVIVPLRARSAMTTVALRRQEFEIVVPLGSDGKATGELYADDGGSSVQPANAVSRIEFAYEDGVFSVGGQFARGGAGQVRLGRITFLGLPSRAGSGARLVTLGGVRGTDAEAPVDVEMRDGRDVGLDSVSVELDVPLTEPFEVVIDSS